MAAEMVWWTVTAETEQFRELGGEQSPWSDDKRFETIAARRPVLEMALFAEAGETPGITLRCDEIVTGLLTGDARTLGRAHVVGVTTESG